MKTLLTAKRRQLTRSASRSIDETVAAWRKKTGAWSSTEMMGLAIRAGALREVLRQYAREHGAFASGKVKVPRTPQGTAPFTVDLDELRQEPIGKRPLQAKTR